MKITSLGHNSTNQANQNYKSKQQNAPAFKGRLSLTATDIKDMPIILRTFNEVLIPYILSKTHFPVRIINHFFSKKTTKTLKFDKSFDSEARSMANRLNLKMIIKNITGFHFKFIEEGEEKL
jgi:hypothetical protein